jgi:hypothetical protein
LYKDSVFFRDLLSDVSLLFVTKPFKNIGFSTKICTWLGYLRWLTAVVLPVSMIFQSRVIFISVTLGLSFFVALFTIISFADRHWFHSLILLITELCALIWILSSLLLVIDRYQD